MQKRACRRDPVRAAGWFLLERRSSRAIVCVAPILLIGGAFDGNSAMKTWKSAISTAPSAVQPNLPVSGPTQGPWASKGEPLTGKVVVVDPGHNGRDWAAPRVVNRLVWNGRQFEACDTAGTETDSGYTEAQFNFNVARYLAADLKAQGAIVVLTRHTNSGVGPCVTERTAIGNKAHANAAISIHADGAPPTGRGFVVLTPVGDGSNDAVIGPSHALAVDIRAAFLAGTGEPVSTYFGDNGLQPSGDVAALNLTTVPKVLIECANMRNPTDAALITTATWQQTAASALAAGLTAFLEHDGHRKGGHNYMEAAAK
jgi:N-acetylmuramoyl-L-alanine amidase